MESSRCPFLLLNVKRGIEPRHSITDWPYVSIIQCLFQTHKVHIQALYTPEVESKTQGSRPRPRTQKKSEAKAKDSFSENRHSRGQGQECSRPRPRTKDTSARALKKKKRKIFTKIFQAISKNKKSSSQKFFRQSPQTNAFQKIFQALHKILTIQKILLSSSRGQANFRGLEASRPRPRT